MSPPTHRDGCIVSNIPVRPYKVTYEPDCPHVKIRHAEITIRAASAGEALAYCRRHIRLSRAAPVGAEAAGPWRGIECPHCPETSPDRREADRHLSEVHGQDALWGVSGR